MMITGNGLLLWPRKSVIYEYTSNSFRVKSKLVESPYQGLGDAGHPTGDVIR